jgi:hypothetical protein
MEELLKQEEKKDEKSTRDEYIKKLKKEAVQIKNQFDACTQYKETRGILKGAKRSVDFYEGRQWLDIKTKLPFEKPILNVTQNMIDDKQASINSKIFKINYSVSGDEASTKQVTRFAEYQMKEMGQAQLERRGTKDGLLKGTFCWYFWWNEDKVGLNGATEGALEGSIVDVENIAVSNPREKDIQKQEYVIIRSRQSVKAVKEACTILNDKEKEQTILPTGYVGYYTKDTEQTSEENTYVYLKFFKQNNEVYFMKSTDDIVFQEPVSLNPLTNLEAEEAQIEGAKEDEMYVNDGVNTGMMTSPSDYTEEEMYKNKLKATMYPVVMKSFIERDGCIFGISFAEQIIPIQKVINQMVATTVLTAIKAPMPTVVVKEGALGTSSVDLSRAGGVIVDRSPQGTDGIKVLNTGSVPTTHYELAQSLISLTKDVYRANDILNDGRNISSGMSAIAIQQLTAIQEKPVAQWQEALSTAIEEEAKILEMFYKLFYRNKQFSYRMSDAELLQQAMDSQYMGAQEQGMGMPAGANMMPMNTANMNMNNVSNYQEDIFNGADYLDTPFNVIVEVGEGAKYSELMLTSTLETLFLNGVISNLSPEDLMMYVELIPDYVFPKKNEFKLLIQQKQNSINAQLQQQNVQLMQALEQMKAQYQADMQRAQAYTQSLTEEYSSKINQYNENLKRVGQAARLNNSSQ